MPHDFAAWLPNENLLTTDELITVIEVAVDEGINEIRLTGGEPLLRPDIVEIVARINAIKNAPKLSMTTNGLALAKLAKPLVDAGLERINISLDTLDPWPAPTMSPVSISRFGTESARAPSVSRRFRLSS